MTKLEKALGIDYNDPNLPPKVKEYIRKYITSHTGKMSYTLAQKHIKEVNKLLNAKETQKEADLRVGTNILKQLPSWAKMSKTQQKATLDSLAIYKTNPKDYSAYNPAELKKLQKPKKVPTPKAGPIYNIPRVVLERAGIDHLYKHIVGDSITMTQTDINKLESASDKVFDPVLNKLVMSKKDKESYIFSKDKFTQKILEDKFDSAEKHKKDLILLKPEIKDSLNKVIETKKANPNTPFKNLFGFWK